MSNLLRMQKYQVIIEFEVGEDFFELLEEHRKYINSLINRGNIDQYAISGEHNVGWITMTAHSAKEAERLIRKSPLAKYFEIQVDALMVFDGSIVRMPRVSLN